MIGVSIYLSKERVEKQEEWLKVAKENGFTSIFTSLHIPEDDPNTYKELIQILGKQALPHFHMLALNGVTILEKHQPLAPF
ncbi:MupG family TIM beta-alpha barrel fold protein, partial [Bacillus sp. HC-Mk]